MTLWIVIMPFRPIDVTKDLFKFKLQGNYFELKWKPSDIYHKLDGKRGKKKIIQF
jgi:hypothetical protein